MAQHSSTQTWLKRKRFIYPIRKVLFLDESGHEPQLRAVHASGATAKEAKMGGEARPSGSGVGLMHRLRSNMVNGNILSHNCFAALGLGIFNPLFAKLLHSLAELLNSGGGGVHLTLFFDILLNFAGDNQYFCHSGLLSVSL